MNDLEILFTLLDVPVMDRGDGTGRDQSAALSNGIYSNRPDQAGLDSPPFDDVKAL
jgi:hypothetical protein